VPLTIRPATAADADAIAAVYAHHVAHGTGTFELQAPDAAEIAQRLQGVLAAGGCWLVATEGSVLRGYAYAAPFRPRGAYRHCHEDSIYLAPGATGRGLGRALLAELLARCEAGGVRQMVAVIGDSANAASIGLHRALGFEPAGVLKAAGWKFGRWVDVVFMQRSLGLGDNAPAPIR
jgi:phosphinothricin acetyltransferase